MTKSDIKTNKLNIYLIRKKFKKYDEIIKKRNKPKEKDNINKLEILDSNGAGKDKVFYYSNYNPNSPDWLKSFFKSEIRNMENIEDELYSSSVSAVYLVKLEVLEGEEKTEAVERIFALCFGYGRTLLNSNTYERRFGLKIALNSIAEEEIRAIDKKSMTANPKQTKEQILKLGNFSNFAINDLQDLLRGLTGRVEKNDKNPGKELFGNFITSNSISGKDALAISAKVDIDSFDDFLKACHDGYKSRAYTDNYPWVDNIQEVIDDDIIEKLNKKLFDQLESPSFDLLWMGVPEAIDWDKVKKFKFNSDVLDEDIDLGEDINDEFFWGIDCIKNRKEWSLEDLEEIKIDCVNEAGENIDTWNMLHCLYYETSIDNRNYILTDGLWHEIEKDFSKRVNDVFERISNSGKQSSIIKKLPNFECKREDEYNKAVAENNPEDFFCMDKKIIEADGMPGRIEFCDLISSEKHLIHVKIHRGSSGLSHLFSQGKVSAQLFLEDYKFRAGICSELLEAEEKFKIPADGKPNTSEYTIVFAVIYKERKKYALPFFSMVNLFSAVQDLERMNYEVCFTMIESA